MPTELKLHIANFVDQLPVKKKGSLMATIYEHILFKQHMEEKEIDVFNDDKPVIRIHKAPQEECESCSA